MSLDSFIAIGREKKVKRFVAHFDLKVIEGGADPLLPATAAIVAEQLRTSPEEAWKQLAKEMGETKTPSEASRLGVVNVYRVRAEQEPLGSLSGEPVALDPLVQRYVDLVDARTTRKGNDPHDVKTAEAIAELLGNYKSAGQWMTLTFALRARQVPDLRVRHDVVNVYRVRAGLGAREWPKSTPTACPVCSVTPCATVTDCEAKEIAGSWSPQALAEQGEAMRESDRQQTLAKRFGGSR